MMDKKYWTLNKEDSSHPAGGRTMEYLDIIEARRRLRVPPGYETLTDVGLDGLWVTPPQMTSRNPFGLVLLAWHFLGAANARRERWEILRGGGYAPSRGFNKVLDRALSLTDLTRGSVYITQVFHLLPYAGTSSTVPVELVRQSFEEVTQYEVEGRVVVTLGNEARRAYRDFTKELPHECAPHPSSRSSPRSDKSRGWTYERRAQTIAEALERAKQFLPKE